jgi:hypothetical protein
MSKVVRNPYRNCQAADPSKCRYHSIQFAKIEELKSNISEFFLKTENISKPSRVIEGVIPREDPIKFWGFCDQLVEDEDKETRRALYAYADDYGSTSFNYLLNNPESILES